MKGVKMFERIVVFVIGFGMLVGGFIMYVLIFNPTSLGVQGTIPLPMAILLSVAGIFYTAEGIYIMYGSIKRNR